MRPGGAADPPRIMTLQVRCVTPGMWVTCAKSSLGCPPRRLMRREGRLERPTFGLTIARPQSRVVVGKTVRNCASARF
jgi:hypothetical protein